MRAWLVSIVLVGGCWTGADALGLRCDSDLQCGDGQRCELGYCGGPPASTGSSSSNTATSAPTGESTTLDTTIDPSTTTTESSGSSTTTTGMPDTETETGSARCEPPQTPRACTGGPVARTPHVTQLVDTALGRATAVVTADLVGATRPDLAVLSFDTYAVHVLRNDPGEQWSIEATLDDLGVDEPYDMIAVDLDCDGPVELAIATINDPLAIVPWDGEAFGNVSTVIVQTANFSLAAADLIDDGDGFPEIAISGNPRVQVVHNVGGMLTSDGIATYEDMFYEPWDTLILDVDGDRRIIVPESNDGSIMGAADQRVHMLRMTGGGDLVQATPPVLSDDFRNPWAVAAGDFDGNGSIDVAVLERNLNMVNEGTTLGGTVRFFAIDGNGVTELVDGGLPVGVGGGVLAAADLDCDGADDLVIGNGGPPGVGGEPQILFGGEDLGNDTMLVPIGMDGLAPGNRMAVGDYDLDGRPEVAIPDYGPMGAGNRVVFVDLED